MSHEPTIVLVHGAFADASSWNGVVERLLQGGHHVVAPANPLRGLAADSAYIASYIGQIDGPTILVGHSYGGAVVSNAASRAKNVLALVFVAAFAPENGETLGGAEANSKDSVRDRSIHSSGCAASRYITRVTRVAQCPRNRWQRRRLAPCRAGQ